MFVTRRGVKYRKSKGDGRYAGPISANGTCYSMLCARHQGQRGSVMDTSQCHRQPSQQRRKADGRCVKEMDEGYGVSEAPEGQWRWPILTNVGVDVTYMKHLESSLE